MDDRYQYLLLMAACLAITLPLEWVFRARVYRRPRRLLLAMLPMLVIFVVWDIVGIVRGHWSYSEQFTTGILLPFDVPLEELVFFIVIPICALLTFESVGNCLTWLRSRRTERASADA